MQHAIEELSFFTKVRRFAAKLPFVTDVVALYYCMRDTQTPTWAKVQIALAIAYFVSPIDAIPDLLPMLGFTDDAAVIATTISIVRAHVNESHRSAARTLLER